MQVEMDKVNSEQESEEMQDQVDKLMFTCEQFEPSLLQPATQQG